MTLLLVAGAGTSHVATGATTATGRLHVNLELARGARDYRHGSRARLRVRDASGRSRALHRSRRALSIALPAGRYRLLSWQRPCADAACRRLLATADRCSLTVGLGAGQRVVAVVRLRPRHGCSFETADAPASPSG